MKNENKYDDEYGYLNTYKHSKLQSTDDDMMKKIIDYSLDQNTTLNENDQKLKYNYLSNDSLNNDKKEQLK